MVDVGMEGARIEAVAGNIVLVAEEPWAACAVINTSGLLEP
jgi:hypothetical protein